MNAVTKREKERYDWKAHGDMFEAGDLVWLHNLQCHKVNQGNYTAHGLVHSQSSNTSQMQPTEFNIVDPRSVVQGWWSTWIDSSYAHLV